MPRKLSREGRGEEFIHTIKKKGHHDTADGENMDVEVCRSVDSFHEK